MIQTGANPAITRLVERLLAQEEVAPVITEADRLATSRVYEKLRRPLSHLVGQAGVNSLLKRALTLAKRESPALNSVHVMEDNSLVGFAGEAAKASSVLVAHLLQLLVTFIGEGLTLRLLHDIWPEVKVLDESTGQGSYEQ